MNRDLIFGIPMVSAKSVQRFSCATLRARSLFDFEYKHVV